MANRIYIDGNDIKFEDGIQTTSRSLDSIVKGDNSAHKTRHQAGGSDIVDADTVDTKHASDLVQIAGVQTITGKKTFSDDIVFSGDKIIQTNVKAKMYLSANQLNIVNNTNTKILFNTVSYDVGSDLDIGNNKFVAPVDGYYLLCGCATWLHNTIIALKRYAAIIYKNGVALSWVQIHASCTEELNNYIANIYYLSANDYIELYVYHFAGVDTPDIAGREEATFLTIHLLSV